MFDVVCSWNTKVVLYHLILPIINNRETILYFVTMMSSMNESIAGVFGGGNSVDGGTGGDSFDYRSLLPTRSSSDPGGGAAAGADGISADDDDACGGLCGYLPQMTWRERLLGCATCMIAGYLLSFGSFFRIKDLLLGNPIPFVMNATVGNLIALAGSFFLKGPKTQLRQMWHESRRHATGLYLGSLFLTLFVAFLYVPGPKGLYLIILMVCQYLSITWYCLSYIPFAREAITSYMQRRFSSDEY